MSDSVHPIPPGTSVPAALNTTTADDARDAARYRWLREWVNRSGGPVVAMNGGACPGQRWLFDAAIDAAMGEHQ